MAVKHAFTSAVADGADATLVRPSNWNANHDIDNDTVSDAHLRNSGALSVIGRSANTVGDPADISATAATDAVLRESGSVLGFGTIATAGIANDAVTYAKMQNVSATDRLLGRDTAAAGDVEELTVSGGVEFTGTGGIQTSALTGDVTKAAGGTATTIANDAVTFAKMQNIATDKLIGRDTAASGDPEEIGLSAPLSFNGSGNVQIAGFTHSGFTLLTSGTAATYTVPAGVRAITVEGIGGGGGGGGSDGAASSAGYGVGGSSGSWGMKSITSPAATYEYTIGPGGAGGAAGNNVGAAGSNTTFGNPAVLTCNGGNPGSGSGTAGTSLIAINGSTAAVAGSGGDINHAGGPGGGSIRLSGSQGLSGFGGAGRYGGDARSVASANAGVDATIPGAGGGGAAAVGATDQPGGDGAGGLIIVWEYK